MFFLQKPSRERILEVVDRHSDDGFRYPSVGLTREGEHPPEFRLDHHRVRLGAGEATFEAAKRALCQWRHFELGWVELFRTEQELAPNQTVGVLARAMGIWALNLCRVVYVVEEELPVHRFAFAYGTLPKHVESGEERFQIEWLKEDDSVWYDIVAFSRPNLLLAKVVYPYTRRKQKQFARDSLSAMQAAIDVAQE